MASLPEQQMATPIIDRQFLEELEVCHDDVSGLYSTKTYMSQEHLEPHDGAFFWVVKVLDEHYCQRSISVEAL